MEQQWASSALYGELMETLQDTSHLSSFKLFLVPSAGYLVIGDDVNTLRGIMHVTVHYWKGDNICDTEIPEATAVSIFGEAEIEKLVRTVLCSLKRGLDLFEEKDDGHFVRTRSGSPGNPYGFYELCPSLASTDTAVFAFIYVDHLSDISSNTVGGSRSGVASSESVNVYIVHTDCQTTIGGCILTDTPQLSNLSAQLCQLSIREAAIVEDAALEGVLVEQGLVYSTATETFKRSLEFDPDAASARIKRLLLLESQDAYASLLAQSRSANLVTRIPFSGAKHTAVSGTQVLVTCFLSLLENVNLESITEHSQNSTDAPSTCIGTFLFEVPAFSSTMLYTMADMSSLKIVDYQSSTRKTLYSILNKTVTQQGALQLLRWLRAPLTSLTTISYRHDIVQYLLGEQMSGPLHSSVRRLLRSCPPFSKTAFLLRAYARARQSSTAFSQLLDVYVFMRDTYDLIIDLFCGVNDANSNSTETSVIALATKLQDLQMETLDFSQLIERTFDLESPYLLRNVDTLFADPGEIYLSPGYNEDLDILRKDLDTNNASIQSDYLDISENIKGCRLIFIPSQGYVIRAPKSSYARVSSRTDIVILENKASYVKFTTERLKNYSLQRMDAYNAYFSLQKEMEPEIIRNFAPFSQLLDRLGALLSEIDCLASFSYVSAGTLGETDNTMVWKWTRPRVSETGGLLRLVECKNPVLMSTIGAQSTVGNTIDFTSRILLLTGPNAGGKTTLLRSIGHCIVLAQIGCFVPCEVADIPIQKRLSVRLGTGDCLSKGYSTFMYEMVSMSHILSSLADASLVLVDELGRGTSTAEGFGISRGIVETLTQQPNCLALLSTHIVELPASFAGVSTVKPVHMLSKMVNNQLRLLYRMNDGIIESTYGLDIASSMGIPQDILDDARSIINLTPKHTFRECVVDKDYTSVLMELTGSLVGYQKGILTKEQLKAAHNRALEELHTVGQAN